MQSDAYRATHECIGPIGSAGCPPLEGFDKAEVAFSSVFLGSWPLARWGFPFRNRVVGETG